MSNTETEAIQFNSYCGLTGMRYHAQVIRHNGRRVVSIHPLSIDGLTNSATPHFSEQEKLYINLNPLERRTWLRLLTGWSIATIARDENVSPAAIRARIQGNSKGQGGMIAKNFWVLLWWKVRRKSQTANSPTYEITD